MKIGVITQPNTKGQVVIPKKFRDELGIDSSVQLNMLIRGNGLYIYPITHVISVKKSDNNYSAILQKTKGALPENWDTLSKKRRALELSASRKRKQLW
jgi:AbrB family looped-hinge helix DNA binding protein